MVGRIRTASEGQATKLYWDAVPNAIGYQVRGGREAVPVWTGSKAANDRVKSYRAVGGEDEPVNVRRCSATVIPEGDLAIRALVKPPRREATANQPGESFQPEWTDWTPVEAAPPTPPPSEDPTPPPSGDDDDGSD